MLDLASSSQAISTKAMIIRERDQSTHLPSQNRQIEF